MAKYLITISSVYGDYKTTKEIADASQFSDMLGDAMIEAADAARERHLGADYYDIICTFSYQAERIK